MILSLNPHLTPEEIDKLFKAFDTDANQKISFDEYYAKLCKMVQIVNVPDSDLRNSIKKVQSKKKWEVPDVPKL